MATRYLPGSAMAFRNKNGTRAVINPDYVHRADGLPGYPEDMVKTWPKQIFASLRSFEVTGGPKSDVVEVEDEVVETATAEPGVKRTVATPKAIKTTSTSS